MINQKKQDRLSAALLRDVLFYDPKTGEFIWWGTAPKNFLGKAAGTKAHNSGYVYIKVNGHQYGAHRLAWLYMTGQWPEKALDHVNGNQGDNRFCNLRKATMSQNKMNSRRRSDNTSGFKGVSWHSRDKVWIAQIYVGRKNLSLGYFQTKEDAYEAYCQAAKKHYGQYARMS